MKSLKTVIAYQRHNRTYLESFITVAEKGANAVSNLLKAHPVLLAEGVNILSVRQYENGNLV